MADINKLSRLVNGVNSNVAIDENTLVVDNLKIKDGNSDSVTFDLGTLTADRTITIPDADVDLGDVSELVDDVADLVTLSGVAANATDLGTFTGTTIPDGSDNKEALQALETAHEEVDQNVNDLITLSGVAENAVNLGTFTGTTIPDNQTVKSALQALETAHETLATDVSEIDQNVNDLITLSGVAENAVNLGTFTGTTIADNETVKGALQDLEDGVELRLPLAGGTMTGSIDMNGFSIIGLDEPVAASDAATKGYVDAVAEGLKPKTAVRAATTVAGTLATDFDDASVIDGVTLATGDRILIKDQADAEENGIYVVQASGAPVRATDFDSLTPIDEINGAMVAVQEGTANAGKIFVQSGTVAVLDTDPITFVFFNSSASLVGGDGITVSGSNISVDHDGEGLTFSATQLALELDGSTLSKSASGVKVATGGITNTEVNASAAIAYSKLALSNSIVNADINSSAAIDATKIANGTISNTEFQYLNNVSSNIQTQLDSKLDMTSEINTDNGSIISLAHTKSIVYLTGSGPSLEGIAATPNKILYVVNKAGSLIQIYHEDLDAAASDRITLPSGTEYFLSPDESVAFYYDSVTSRWLLLNQNAARIFLTHIEGSSLIISGDAQVSGQLTASTDIRLAGTLDEASTGNIAALTSEDVAAVRLTGNGAKILQGIDAGLAGSVLIVHNVGTGNLTLKNEDAAATAANRIITSNAEDVVLYSGGSVLLRYETAANRWRVVSHTKLVATAVDSSSIVEDNYVAGETLALGDIVILRAPTVGGNLRWYKAGAAFADNATADLNKGINFGDSDVIGVAQAAAASAGDAVNVIMQGEAVVNTTLTAGASFDKGSIVYLSATKGAVAETSPSSSGDLTVRLGKAVLMGSAGTAKIYVKANYVGIN